MLEIGVAYWCGWSAVYPHSSTARVGVYEAGDAPDISQHPLKAMTMVIERSRRSAWEKKSMPRGLFVGRGRAIGWRDGWTTDVELDVWIRS